MIKAIGGAGDRRILMLGLSHGNLERLKDGKPIFFAASSLGGLEDISDVLIFAGETEETMRNDLAALLPADVPAKGSA